MTNPGAGISTESGISDYRSKGGIWDQFKPVYYDEFLSSEDARIEHWRQKMELYDDLIKAVPNPAHLGIVTLDKMGLLEAVITQNIDGLHQAAGLGDEKVVELHGNSTRARCLSCRDVITIAEAHRRIAGGDPAPVCDCGGYIKTDTISFGQAMPVAEMERAADLAEASPVRTSGCCSAKYSRSWGQTLRPFIIIRSFSRPVITMLVPTR